MISEFVKNICQAFGISLITGFITQVATTRFTQRVQKSGEDVVIEYEIPGLSKKIIEKRAIIHALTTLPIVKPKEIKVEEIAKGPILKRYKVTIIGKTLRK